MEKICILRKKAWIKLGFTVFSPYIYI